MGISKIYRYPKKMLSPAVQRGIDNSRRKYDEVFKLKEELINRKPSAGDYQEISSSQRILFEAFSVFKGIFLRLTRSAQSIGYIDVSNHIRDEMVKIDELLGELELLKWFSENKKCLSAMMSSMAKIASSSKSKRKMNSEKFEKMFSWDSYWKKEMAHEGGRFGIEMLLVDALLSDIANSSSGFEEQYQYPLSMPELVYIFSRSLYSREIVLYTLMDVKEMASGMEKGEEYVIDFCRWFSVSDSQLLFVRTIWELDNGLHTIGPNGSELSHTLDAPTHIKVLAFLKLGIQDAARALMFDQTQLSDVFADFIHIFKLELLLSENLVDSALLYVFEHIRHNSSGAVSSAGKPQLSSVSSYESLVEYLIARCSKFNQGRLDILEKMLLSSGKDVAITNMDGVSKEFMGKLMESMKNKTFWERKYTEIFTNDYYGDDIPSSKKRTSVIVDGSKKGVKRSSFVYNGIRQGKQKQIQQRQMHSPNPLVASPTPRSPFQRIRQITPSLTNSAVSVGLRDLTEAATDLIGDIELPTSSSFDNDDEIVKISSDGESDDEIIVKPRYTKTNSSQNKKI